MAWAADVDSQSQRSGRDLVILAILIGYSGISMVLGQAWFRLVKLGQSLVLQIATALPSRSPAIATAR
jgi:hypothetical protein